MRVLHVNCNYMGSQLHQNMIEELNKWNVENDIFVPLQKLEGHSVIPNSYVTPKVCFRNIDRYFYHVKQHKILKCIQNIFSVEKYDCYHAYTVFTDGNVARELWKKTKIPYVVAVRNTDVNLFFKQLFYLRNVGIKVLRDAKAIFFLSEAYKEEVIEKYIPEKYKLQISKKSYIMPNGIDNFWHDNIWNERNIKSVVERLRSQNVKLVYAGVIDKNKNVTLTCEAKRKMEELGWGIDFTVVGRIRDNAVFSQIKDKVNYLEARPKEELIHVYRNADIFVMPSYHETFGLVYAEAMSQGLPVIYSKGQGFDGQFEEGVVGFRIESYSSDDLVNAILRIIADYGKISNNCLSMVEKFSWKKITKEYLEIYNIVND